MSEDNLSVSLRDGRVIPVPLACYPRLLHASSAQRKNCKISGGGYGIHWPEVDEDLSTEDCRVELLHQDPLCRRSDLDSAFGYDHRLIDGAVADQFMAFMKKTLEGWSEDVG
jgi:hypothetical protein